MPRALSLACRRTLYRLAQQPVSAATLARRLDLPASTVRHLRRRFHDRGLAAVAPDYAACGPQVADPPSPVVAAALDLRRQHPRWGAGRLRLELLRLFPQQSVPADRTLQRWLRRHGLQPARSGRPRGPRADRATQPHQVWQVDAAEQKALATGQLISWLRIVDECSGAVLHSVVFPPRPFQPGARGRGATAFPPRFPPLGTARAAAAG